MATKYEIKKFIERRKNEALSKIIDDRDTEISLVIQKFTSTYNEELSAVKADLEAADDNLDLLCKSAARVGISFHGKYYSNPKKLIDDAFSEMHDCKITKYFDIPEVNKLRAKFEELTDATTREYNRLIAVTGNIPAKDGIELLNSLGFDTSNLVTVKEVTALSISIDVNKLYLTKEAK